MKCIFENSWNVWLPLLILDYITGWGFRSGRSNDGHPISPRASKRASSRKKYSIPRCDPSAFRTAWASNGVDPATSAILLATLVSLAGNTSNLPSPRNKITAAVHGPIPLIFRRSAAASGLGRVSSMFSSRMPEASASATRRKVESFPALSPAVRSRPSFAP